MPKLPCWYSRVPEILTLLKNPGGPPLLDRPAVENLFRVRRRQAIRILGAAKGYQVGKTFIVERAALVQFVEGLEESGVPREALTRKQRIANALNEVANYAAAQKVEIRPNHGALSRRAAELPPSIELVAPGKMLISYSGAEDLLAHLVELASSAANDFPAFRRLYGGEK